jgi:hypothetical protein
MRLSGGGGSGWAAAAADDCRLVALLVAHPENVLGDGHAQAPVAVNHLKGAAAAAAAAASSELCYAAMSRVGFRV